MFPARKLYRVTSTCSRFRYFTLNLDRNPRSLLNPYVSIEAFLLQSFEAWSLSFSLD